MPTTELLRVLGEKIRSKRVAAGLTQNQLGKKAGIVGKYVSEIERGTRDTPISTLRAVAESGLGCRLVVEIEPRNGRVGYMSPVEEMARLVAELPTDDRNRVLAIIRSITELVSR